jgi:Domain of unknown function (DUF222)
MSESRVAAAHRLLAQAVDALAAVAASGAGDELLSVLTVCEGTTRRLDRVVVDAVAGLERDGTLTERGYRSSVGALGDLLGWERFEARRRVVAAEQVTSQVSLDGTPLPPRLPATAAVFTAGQASLRHVEAVARVLATPAARRLDPDRWAAAEGQMAARTGEYTPLRAARLGHRAGRGARPGRRRTRRPPTRLGQRAPPEPDGLRWRQAQGPLRRRGDVRRRRHVPRRPRPPVDR